MPRCDSGLCARRWKRHRVRMAEAVAKMAETVSADAIAETAKVVVAIVIADADPVVINRKVKDARRLQPDNRDLNRRAPRVRPNRLRPSLRSTILRPRILPSRISSIWWNSPAVQAFLFRWMALVLAVLIAAHLSFLGIHYDSIGAVLAAALVLGVVNTFIKPVLMVITIPFILLSFGLFILFINATLFYLAGALVEGFHVNSFASAIGGAVVVSIVNFLLSTDRRDVIVHRSKVEFRSQPPPGKGPVIDV